MSFNKTECINKKGEWFYNFLCNSSAIYTLHKYIYKEEKKTSKNFDWIKIKEYIYIKWLSSMLSCSETKYLRHEATCITIILSDLWRCRLTRIVIVAQMKW